jgi:hypothetical protein
LFTFFIAFLGGERIMRDHALLSIGSSHGQLSRLAGARPAQGQPWQCRQISLRLLLRNISKAEPVLRPLLKGPTTRRRSL